MTNVVEYRNRLAARAPIRVESTCRFHYPKSPSCPVCQAGSLQDSHRRRAHKVARIGTLAVDLAFISDQDFEKVEVQLNHISDQDFEKVEQVQVQPATDNGAPRRGFGQTAPHRHYRFPSGTRY